MRLMNGSHLEETVIIQAGERLKKLREIQKSGQVTLDSDKAVALFYELSGLVCLHDVVGSGLSDSGAMALREIGQQAIKVVDPILP